MKMTERQLQAIKSGLHWSLGLLTQEELEGIKYFSENPYLEWHEASGMVGDVLSLSRARGDAQDEYAERIREHLRERSINCRMCRKAGVFKDYYCDTCKAIIPDYKTRIPKYHNA